ncbi:uncharacterized protein LOC124885683 [Capsicum annuum]|uniref:uncharacterized protein LOC124885683 n=1 Tax=Capsicum annuum TaxID=4072 RepID=UPI001FB12D2B|nr:uncharacterized protein LOC124885683 [Capsicum annuum]
MKFKKYSGLISHLLVTKQHNNLLMKNHESRPPDTAPFPEVNPAYFHQTMLERSPNPSHAYGRSRGRYFNQGDRLILNNDLQHQQCKKKGEATKAVPRTSSKNKCYRCGGKENWSRTCRTSKHLKKLYQASLKKTDNDAETNFIFEDNVEPMNLDVLDFFIVSERHVNHRIGDEYEIV